MKYTILLFLMVFLANACTSRLSNPPGQKLRPNLSGVGETGDGSDESSIDDEFPWDDMTDPSEDFDFETDTDGDGYVDSLELVWGTDPYNPNEIPGNQNDACNPQENVESTEGETVLSDVLQGDALNSALDALCVPIDNPVCVVPDSTTGDASITDHAELLGAPFSSQAGSLLFEGGVYALVGPGQLATGTFLIIEGVVVMYPLGSTCIEIYSMTIEERECIEDIACEYSPPPVVTPIEYFSECTEGTPAYITSVSMSGINLSTFSPVGTFGEATRATTASCDTTCG